MNQAVLDTGNGKTLAAGTRIITEASFSCDGMFCSVDIFINLGGSRIELYEAF